MSQILGRVMLSIVALAALGYAGFQIWRVVNTTYETQPAVEYVVSETITAKGVAIREEKTLAGYSGENLSYLYRDGTHVSANMPVARVVRSKEEITDQMRRSAYQTELHNLQEIPVSGETLVVQADTVTQRIYADIDIIAQGAATGNLAQAEELKFEILNQLNRRSIATGRESNFDARIEELQAKIDELGSDSEEEEENAILAPEQGYFTKSVDGLEGALTPDRMDSLTVDQFVDYINAPVENIPNSVGKIITDHIWYFAAVIPASEADKFVPGYRAELDFGLNETQPILGTIDSVITESTAGARAVVIFECNEMSEELVNLRTHKVDISLSEMTGYKFPRDCKRYQDDQLGVYVLDASVIRFKPVEIIYENEAEDYVVFSTNFGGGDGLQLFDEVIIGGRGLVDGKVIKQ